MCICARARAHAAAPRIKLFGQCAIIERPFVTRAACKPRASRPSRNAPTKTGNIMSARFRQITAGEVVERLVTNLLIRGCESCDPAAAVGASETFPNWNGVARRARGTAHSRSCPELGSPSISSSRTVVNVVEPRRAYGWTFRLSD